METPPPRPVYSALAGLFVGLGLGFVVLKEPPPGVYVVILVFFLVKAVFDVRKCTVSYVECKLRGVPKEEGYVNSFLDGIVDIRNDHATLALLLLSSAVVLGGTIGIQVGPTLA